MDVEEDALQEVDEPLGARVHHAGPLQHGEQLRGPRQGLLRALEQVRDEGDEVRRRGPHRFPGHVPDHGEDRPLHGALQRGIQGLGAPQERLPELGSRDPLPLLHAVGEAQQEVGEHHSAVSTGSQHRRLGGLPGHHVHRAVLVSAEMIRDRLDREGQVGPRVPVGNWKDVDPVELGPHPLGIRAGCHEGTPEAGAVQIGDLHGGRMSGGPGDGAMKAGRDDPLRTGSRPS